MTPIVKQRVGREWRFDMPSRAGGNRNVRELSASSPLEPARLANSFAGHKMSELRLRMIWLTAGLALLAFAWYGSLVPFKFQPCSLSEAWARLIATSSQVHEGSSVD